MRISIHCLSCECRLCTITQCNTPAEDCRPLTRSSDPECLLYAIPYADNQPGLTSPENPNNRRDVKMLLHSSLQDHKASAEALLGGSITAQALQKHTSLSLVGLLLSYSSLPWSVGLCRSRSDLSSGARYLQDLERNCEPQ